MQDSGTGQRCKVGHTGLLCAECSPGYGLDRDDCVKCSTANSSPLAVGGLLAVACFLAGLIYLWRRRRTGRAETALSGELTERLQANPLHGSPRESQGSSSGPGKAATVAQKSTDIYMLMRVVYQPVRIIIGYIQVTFLISVLVCHPAMPSECNSLGLMILACRS